MKQMTNDQINELNGLLVDHGKTLTSFYDEGKRIGKREGFIVGVTTTLVVYGVLKIRERFINRQIEEE